MLHAGKIEEPKLVVTAEIKFIDSTVVTFKPLSDWEMRVSG